MSSIAVEQSAAPTSRFALLWRYRELTWMLAWRDIRVRYKHTLLGAAWAVAPPLMTMFIFTFIFGTVVGIEKSRLTGSDSIPYALFALAGLVPWMFFANGLSSAVSSLTANRQLVTKIYFPREVFPLASVMSAVVDFAVSMLALLGLGIYLHFNGAWAFQIHPAIAWLPLVIAVQLVLMIGLSFLLSMANLYYRDVGLIFRSFIQLNPMTPIIRAYRDCLITGQAPIDASFVGAAVTSIGILMVGWSWFRHCEFDFAEHI